MDKSLHLSWLGRFLNHTNKSWQAILNDPFNGYGGLSFLPKCNYDSEFLDKQPKLLYSWRFSRYSAPIHWLVHGHMTLSQETLRFSGNKIHCSPQDQSLSVKCWIFSRKCIQVIPMFVQYSQKNNARARSGTRSSCAARTRKR